MEPHKNQLNFRKQQFVETVGQDYTFQNQEGKTITLKLASVEDSQYTHPKYERFTLFLTPPEGEPAVEDNSYEFENETLGKFPLFISGLPAFDSPENYEYEAVFNCRIAK